MSPKCIKIHDTFPCNEPTLGGKPLVCPADACIWPCPLHSKFHTNLWSCNVACNYLSNKNKMPIMKLVSMRPTYTVMMKSPKANTPCTTSFICSLIGSDMLHFLFDPRRQINNIVECGAGTGRQARPGLNLVGEVSVNSHAPIMARTLSSYEYFVCGQLLVWSCTPAHCHA